MTLVALSASYGAGGSQIGPGLAERLGVRFLDRAIPLAVAEQLQVPAADAAAHDERIVGSRLERMLSGFIGADTGAPAPLPAETITSEDFRRATEEVLLRHAQSGAGVILGRGAAIVLRDDPRVLRVRLTGPVQRRLEQAMRLGGVEREAAERGLQRLDRVHVDYVRHFYGVDVDDLALYHLVLDSTSVPLDACVEVIALAAQALQAAGVPLSI